MTISTKILHLSQVANLILPAAEARRCELHNHTQDREAWPELHTRWSPLPRSGPAEGQEAAASTRCWLQTPCVWQQTVQPRARC